MKHVSILIPHGHTSLVNIAGTHQIFNQVNNLAEKTIFNVHLVGLTTESKQDTGLFTVYADSTISDVNKTDLIIIPAIHTEQHEGIERNREFIPWMISHYEKGAELASFCIGAYLLAATGLLKGKKCATHWAHAANFRQMYPDVDLVDDRIMTAEDRIYTSGGAYSYLNLLLYLIEKNAGRDAAILASKMFMIDIDKESQSPFIIFEGQKEHGDELVIKAQQVIEKQYREKMTVGEIADKLALSRRSLERRFKRATSNTIVEYIQRVKIEAAKKEFESSQKNVNEVMYEVGYSDAKSFRNLFRSVTGLTPIEYRKKYKKRVAKSV
ncbi:helix-turn-helix domain-containing protein [Rhodohalobacter sp. SW132]|uniref:GlxA family transcriptional regulator n=1 Tax=Rhodohalobacter sp. SW132 TaxID=2293433 RepID=UPI000E237AE1|nr:helix-turn-helix domain-containing protein [Rhodohalobacter sp. SW132]REL23998.1 helix-turn-helix domain-containing protein [Rhodohalobacter sp. SW132]